ncbi:Ribonuclease BN, tRNA processing enzyme [Actinopolyspora mzabensis]|uniref:Ribonuclease BN, tRNA processing enzyme n=1 Tax=Actinopolyspora mzabensis TaxID=995066 RepID=A0A1G9DRS8_ACTMZ|nr:MBL fold metallo-hydrolase [Actinopolyspora mzabensis]SDK66573.1 Ribonuclease BN, tRNA processing enzyme [Actinopolyspora mzabensis]
MTSRLVVLGSCGAWPEPGRACSGFLLEHAGFRVVLDLGYGTLPGLLRLLGNTTASGVDALIVTHRHPDHMVDVHGLFRARWFGERDGAAIPLYAAEGVWERLCEFEEGYTEPLSRVFEPHPLPAEKYSVGPFRLESRSLPHFVPNAGVRLSCDEFVLAYTGDTGPSTDLAALAREADLLIAEATDRHQHEGVPPTDTAVRHDLTSAEAGRIAGEAAARKLLLSHFWPGNDRERSRREAAECFSGDVVLADEELEITLP